MKTLLTVLVSLVAVATCMGTDCVSTSLSLDEKLELNADANDYNNDGQITGADIEYDLDNNYDSNEDGVVDEKEWVNRWTCAYGDTKFYARYVWVEVSQAEPTIRGSDFGAQSFSIPRAAFIASNLQRYQKFQDDGCVNRELTLDKKIRRIVRDNDVNNDQLVTTSDIMADLTNYDTNNDGNLTRVEFVTRFVCAYGESADMANFYWNDMTGGSGGPLPASSFNRSPFDTGLPVSTFEANARRRFAEYAKANPSNSAPHTTGHAHLFFIVFFAVFAHFLNTMK